MCCSVSGVTASGQAEGSLGGWGATEVAIKGRGGLGQGPAGGGNKQEGRFGDTRLCGLVHTKVGAAMGRIRWQIWPVLSRGEYLDDGSIDVTGVAAGKA